MKHFKFISVLCVLLSLLFFVDLVNFSFCRNYLLNETKTISYFVSRDCGVSDELMFYIKNRDYEFVYSESNSNKVGDVVSYSLIKFCDSFFVDKKEIVIIQYVVLGS